jgi:uncharacterized protein (TIGR02246 family)
MKVSAGVCLQSIESGEVADRLAAIVELGPLNHTVEFGGPQVFTIDEMTQACLQSRGRKAVVRAEPLSDPMFSTLGSDTILHPNHATGLMAWKEFLDRSHTGERKEEPMAVEANKQNDEAEIKRVLEGGVEAIRDKNIEGVMSLYAQDVVSFDIVPPLRYVGADAFRKAWEAVFSSFQGPIGYEMHDPTITVGDDVAFSYSLNRISGTMNNGLKTDLWLRWTACWRSINGKWLIVHHQNSVPVDLQTGRAVLDGKP